MDMLPSGRQGRTHALILLVLCKTTYQLVEDQVSPKRLNPPQVQQTLCLAILPRAVCGLGVGRGVARTRGEPDWIHPVTHYLCQTPGRVLGE